MTVMPTQRRWGESFAARTRTGSSGALASILALSGRTDLISFAGGLPDPITLPGESLTDLVRDVTTGGDASAIQYSPVRGLRGPLSYLAERLQYLENRRPSDDELMITSGCVEALELLGKTFLDAGDTALVEAPSYLGAIMGFKSFQADVRGIPMDAEGVEIGPLAEAMAAEPRPKLFYTIPDYQNPTGLSLSLERRTQVVDLARRFGVPVVEDVTYRALGFDHQPPSSLWSLGPDVAVQIGTFSKTFFPGVRLGWAVGPPEIISQMVLAKQNTDQCAGALGQRLMEEYGRRGHLDRQIARAQTFYGRRRDLMMESLQRHTPEGVTWTHPHGGFVTWLAIPGNADLDTTALAERAMEEKVAFVPGPVFFPDARQGRKNLRLSFSGVRDEDIDEGIRRLGLLLRRALEPGGQR